jgi:hypothetical protein
MVQGLLGNIQALQQRSQGLLSGRGQIPVGPGSVQFQGGGGFSAPGGGMIQQRDELGSSLSNAAVGIADYISAAPKREAAAKQQAQLANIRSGLTPLNGQTRFGVDAQTAEVLRSLPDEQLMKAFPQIALAAGKEPSIIKGADGYNYYSSGPQKGERVLPGVVQQPKDPNKLMSVAPGSTLFDPNTGEAVFTAPDRPKEAKKREREKGADGRLRYVDSGELVFPSVEKPEEKPKMSDVSNVRKEFNGVKNPLIEQVSQFRKVQGFGDLGTKESQLAFIISIAKTLDPGSVVREGEFATFARSGGIFDTLRNAFNSAKGDNLLGKDQINNFVDVARTAATEAARQYVANEKDYRSLAQDNKIDPSQIIGSDPLGTNMRNDFGLLTREEYGLPLDRLPSDKLYSMVEYATPSELEQIQSILDQRGD